MIPTVNEARDVGSPDRFIDRLTLEPIDRDIFTGRCHSGAPLRAYGGQIAAQALMAAGMTVEDAARHVHSLHGYFLRPGHTKDTITYLVDRPRDGGSFSTRIVRAVQHGETIFMMTASFSVIDPGPEHQFGRPSAGEPEDALHIDLEARWNLEGHTRVEMDYPLEDLIDLRIVGDPTRPLTAIEGRYERQVWVRITEPLPDDPLIQACALTYLSDLTMVQTAISPHLDVRASLQVTSIDHAVWFHRRIDANDWLQFSQDTPIAQGGHGMTRGLFFNRPGELIASVVQESLMRTHRPA